MTGLYQASDMTQVVRCLTSDDADTWAAMLERHSSSMVAAWWRRSGDMAAARQQHRSTVAAAWQQHRSPVRKTSWQHRRDMAVAWQHHSSGSGTAAARATAACVMAAATAASQVPARHGIGMALLGRARPRRASRPRVRRDRRPHVSARDRPPPAWGAMGAQVQPCSCNRGPALSRRGAMRSGARCGAPQILSKLVSRPGSCAPNSCWVFPWGSSG